MNNCVVCQPQRIQLYGQGDMENVNLRGKTSLQKRVTMSLYNKYAESQNYYYTKDINEIILEQPSKATVFYKDLLLLDEQIEYMKKLYTNKSRNSKMVILTEFYKFHKDLPRWSVVSSVVNILNEYYNIKRKLEYYKIQKMIQEENQMNPDKPPKGIVGDKPVESVSTPYSRSEDDNQEVGNVLDELHLTERNSVHKPPIKVNQKLGTERERDTYVINLTQNSIFGMHNINQIKQLVKMQKKQLLIKDPEQCGKLEPQLPKTKHQQILEQLNSRVKEKLAEKKKTKGKREVQSMHLEQNRKENFFKSPRNAKINMQDLLSTKTKKLNTFHNDGSNKKLQTGHSSARLNGLQSVKATKKPIQFKTLTTPRSIQQK